MKTRKSPRPRLPLGPCLAAVALNLPLAASAAVVAQQAYLKASNTGAGDFFGYSVAVSGDTMVVGAHQESSNTTGVNGNQSDNSAPGSGAAYVFVRSGTTWSQQAYLKASNTGAGDFFGISVAVSGGTVVVGAPNSADAGAAYVFVRSGTNWSQQAYLKASNGETGDFFGYSVAVSGDTVVVGAWGEASNGIGVNGNQSNNSVPGAGAAYVFVRSGTNWSQQAYLKASNTGEDDEFGISVAVSGDMVVVGAPVEDSSATGVNGDQSSNSAGDSGAAYVFVRNGTNWSQQAYLKASNTGFGDNFGRSVAAAGDTVVVGAYVEDSNATGVNGNQSDNSADAAGAAYVFARSGTNWSQQAYLKASNTGVDDQFGMSVSVSGDTVVVGAPNEDSDATSVNGSGMDPHILFNSGAGYVFARTGTNWTQQAYLKAFNTGALDGFGESVSVSGGTVVVGALGEDSNVTGVNGNRCDNSSPDSGAAYVFDPNSPAIFAPEIAVEQPPGSYLSGGSAAVDFGAGLIGASSQRTFTIWNTGNADLTGLGITVTGPNAGDFTITANPAASLSGACGSTTFTVTFTPGGAGSSTAALQIASNDSDESPFDIMLTGMGVTPLQIVQQAYLKASNTGADDFFGISLAVSGDTVVVGAHGEDSNATGVNGNQSNNSASRSGAAYVFVRSGITWIQQAYLKASNAGDEDLFGHSVAVSGDTVVVGAIGESSDVTGVNGDQGNNSVQGAGAAYVFVRSGTNWSQQAYLKASNTEMLDGFGISVAVSGDTVVVGAYQEDSNATGVNGDQGNNGAVDSGAAYVFARSGTNWIQQAYLKASNTRASYVAYFGYSVAVSGDTVVVGAYQEASSATGVNGDQSDTSLISGAAYVFVRSGTGWIQQAYLKASNTGANDRFGYSVAVSDDTVVVGAPLESSNATGVNGNQTNNSAYRSGAAYVFVRSGTSWSQQAYLKASNTGPADGADLNDYFGYSVAVSGDTVIVGAWAEDSSATGVNGNQNDNSARDSGAAYFFARNGTNWIQHAYLKASNPGGGFGNSVAVSGDSVVVGAPYELSNATEINGNQCGNSARSAGAAYIFELNAIIALGAPEIAVEQPSGADLRDGLATVEFGAGLVGARSQRTFTIRNNGNADLTGFGITITGANSNDFIITTNPTAPVSGPCGSTMFSVTFSPGAVGARTADLHITSNDSDESPFDITISGKGVTPFQMAQQAYFKASNTGGEDYFGNSVAVSGDTVVVGAPQESSNAIGVNGNQTNNSAVNSGAAYVFVRSETNWLQQAYLKASNTGANDQFGYSVAVSGDTVVVGAHQEDSNAVGVNGNQNDDSAVNSGATYVFVRSGATWSQQAYLKASNAGAQDYFGYSVAVSGDTAVIGAYQESSNATGVNGNQTNNSVFRSGAAYVFVRSETNWLQQGYLKASNTGVNDYFGYSVAVSGDTVVIGAHQEDSKATGANGDQSDNSAVNSGAAYVFVRSGTNWIQQAYLKASDTGAQDYFGYSVTVSGDTVVVGAYLQDSGAAYVFVRSDTNWLQQGYLKAFNTGALDYFGYSVAVSGDTLVVGAYGEDSYANGVNGDQSDNSASQSGAAYVFKRSGTDWIQRAYLKASNTGANDRFGWAVALSDDTVVIGAIFESSNATGVNGSQTNNSAFLSGAAYIFTGVRMGPRLTLLPDGGGGYFLRINGTPDSTYRLHRSPKVTGPWDTIATLSTHASGFIEYHDTPPPSGQVFYRTVQP